MLGIMDVSRCDHLELCVVCVLVTRRHSGIGRVEKLNVVHNLGNRNFTRSAYDKLLKGILKALYHS
jgi:hypothetical protein